VFFAVAVYALAASAPGPASATAVSQALRAAAAAEPVEVFVWLEQPPPSYGEPQRRSLSSRQRRSFLAKLSRGHVEVAREFESVAAFTLRVEADALDEIAALPGVVGVAPMQYGSAALAESVPQVGAAELHQRGLLGEGAVLGMLDTGIDGSHPDIAGRVDAEECICSGCCPGPSSAASGPGSAQSQAVHGPHVAGILASAGVVSAKGMAPAAHLVVVRVLNDLNRGSLSDWLGGLDLILSQHPEVVAVNMSLVSDMLYAPNCDNVDVFTQSFAYMVDQLRRRGTLVVAAAGNNQLGHAPGVLPLPGCLRNAISVGAVDKSDAIAVFSNVAANLDLLAPGVAIRSDAPGGTTAFLSGTSMAAPHVTASAALLLPFVGRPFIPALPSVLRTYGIPIVDDRFCDNGKCLAVPRLDVAAAADWLETINSYYFGGGARSLDCQAEWSVAVPSSTEALRANRFRCVDGDPACDADNIAGQCTFTVRACFNVPDQRLVTCDPLQTVTALRLLRPSLTDPRDDMELGNAVRLLGSMPDFPIPGAGQCGDEFAFSVPVGPARTLRTVTETQRGRDVDRLRFSCAPYRGTDG